MLRRKDNAMTDTTATETNPAPDVDPNEVADLKRRRKQVWLAARILGPKEARNPVKVHTDPMLKRPLTEEEDRELTKEITQELRQRNRQAEQYRQEQLARDRALHTCQIKACGRYAEHPQLVEWPSLHPAQFRTASTRLLCGWCLRNARSVKAKLEEEVTQQGGRMILKDGRSRHDVIEQEMRQARGM
jgi:hypothetical protein